MNLGNVISRTLGMVIGVALLGYTTSRTVHLFGQLLPDDMQWTKFLAVAAFDGGLVVWAMLFLFHARGYWQRGIALLTSFVSMIGVVVSFIADTMWVLANKGQLAQPTEQTTWTVVLGTSVIVAVHVVAFVSYEVFAPHNVRRMKAESAQDRIEHTALEAVEQRSDLMAPRLAQQLADRWEADTLAKYHAGHRIGQVVDGVSEAIAGARVGQLAPAHEYVVRRKPGLFERARNALVGETVYEMAGARAATTEAKREGSDSPKS